MSSHSSGIFLVLSIIVGVSFAVGFALGVGTGYFIF